MNMITKKNAVAVSFLLGVLAILFFASTAQAANLIINGSFETPDTPAGTDPGPPHGFIGYPVASTALTGWSISGETVYVLDGFDNFDAYAFDSVASDGDQFVQLQNAGVASTISQTIATTVGVTYALSFDYGGVMFDTPTTTRTLTYNYGAGDQTITYDVTNLNLAENEWWSHSVNFVATSTSTTISFTGDGSAGFWGPGIDNVSFSAIVPEPSTFTLAALGLLTLSLPGRRRRRR